LAEPVPDAPNNTGPADMITYRHCSGRRPCTAERPADQPADQPAEWPL